MISRPWILWWFLLVVLVSSPLGAQIGGSGGSKSGTGTGTLQSTGVQPGSVEAAGRDGPVGDTAVAGKYVDWALSALEQGNWTAAEQALEGASDFSDQSSDASYLLALVRFTLNRPIGAVLEADKRALAVHRWSRYTEAGALLLEAQALIDLRSFSEALEVLQGLSPSSDSAYLRLRALWGLHDWTTFRRTMAAAFDAYPLDTRFPRLLLECYTSRLGGAADQVPVDRVLKRLPDLVQRDSSIGFLAVPFIRDPQEARRLVEAYRAVGTPDIRSLVPALRLGVVDGPTATKELFSSPSPLPVELIRSIWSLLGTPADRETFAKAFSLFTGTLTEDSDGDGRPEARSVYKSGALVSYFYDDDQDGIDDLELSLTDGLPQRGKIVLFGKAETDSSPGQTSAEGGKAPTFARPVRPEDLRWARLSWSTYPWLSRVEVEQTTYIPAPQDFPFQPVKIRSLLTGPQAPPILYPFANDAFPRLTERSLVSFASIIELPGVWAPQSIEKVELVKGIPQRATETYRGMIITETEFSQGWPSLERLDLDLDGRMETLRHFPVTHSFKGIPDLATILQARSLYSSSESDWNGDGIYEYREQRLPDGKIVPLP